MDGGVLTPDQAVDGCLDLVGPMTVDEPTRRTLIAHVERDGDIDLGDRSPGGESERRVGELLQLIASTREFQLA